MAWLLLILAGVLEVVWAIWLPRTDGFRKLWPSVITIAAMVASFWLLAQAVITIPIGTGYAVWVGIGAAGTAILAIAWYGEPATAPRLACILLIVLGVMGLKLTSP